MNFESQISLLNESYFFKEFTYSKNQFRNSGNQVKEAGDCIISLDEIMIIFEIKERKIQSNTTSNEEKIWFQNKILKKATKQIRMTINYLKNNVILNNRRNHAFDVTITSMEQLHKMVIYLANPLLPDDCRKMKYYSSETVGIIHLMEANDWRCIVQTLITPAEIVEYLTFREVIIQKWKNFHSFDEISLLGQYLSGEHSSMPSNSFTTHFKLIDHNFDTWDILGLLHLFPSKITNIKNEHDYYFIVKEIAKLLRFELKVFKESLILSMNKSKEDTCDLPYRFAIPRLDCGFIFIPIVKKDDPNDRQILLEAYIRLHKYDRKITTCIGLTIFANEDGSFEVEWGYLSHPWMEDDVLKQQVENLHPFREVDLQSFPRFDFDKSPI